MPLAPVCSVVEPHLLLEHVGVALAAAQSETGLAGAQGEMGLAVALGETEAHDDRGSAELSSSQVAQLELL